MEVILNETIKKLGHRGEVISVKRGYFRNYLIPKGLAHAATAAARKLAGIRKEKMVIEKDQLIENAKDVLKKLKGLKLTISAKAGEKGKLYASITEKDVIAEMEKTYKMKLEKSFIKMDQIKELGDHEITIDLGDKLTEKIVVVVEAAE